PMRISWRVVCVLSLLVAACNDPEDEDEGKSREHVVDPAVVRASVARRTVTPSADPATGWTSPVRLGYTAGDQWEPAIATDGATNVYMLYPQYSGVPGCPACPSPTMGLPGSDDSGATWSAPRIMGTPGNGQWDAQIAVDPADGNTVYAAWLQNNHCDTVVAKSTNQGKDWSIVVANHTNSPTDKDILAVRGPDVYV